MLDAPLFLHKNKLFSLILVDSIYRKVIVPYFEATNFQPNLCLSPERTTLLA